MYDNSRVYWQVQMTLLPYKRQKHQVLARSFIFGFEVWKMHIFVQTMLFHFSIFEPRKLFVSFGKFTCFRFYSHEVYAMVSVSKWGSVETKAQSLDYILVLFYYQTKYRRSSNPVFNQAFEVKRIGKSLLTQMAVRYRVYGRFGRAGRKRLAGEVEVDMAGLTKHAGNTIMEWRTLRTCRNRLVRRESLEFWWTFCATFFVKKMNYFLIIIDLISIHTLVWSLE